jgi:predicted adenylyl cyclase CyaB
MPVEIEIKLRVQDFAPVRARLESLSAAPLGQALETNIFLDTAERALLSADCGLRVRRSRKADGREKRVVTYKGPRGEGQVKQREEVEVVVDSLDSAVLLLDRLGYAPQLTFEKRRESWRVNECTVELDELPEIGCFVEVEGPSVEAVSDVQRRLGLQHARPVMPTYADLVTRHLNDAGAHTRELRFKS